MKGWEEHKLFTCNMKLQFLSTALWWPSLFITTLLLWNVVSEDKPLQAFTHLAVFCGLAPWKIHCHSQLYSRCHKAQPWPAAIISAFSHIRGATATWHIWTSRGAGCENAAKIYKFLEKISPWSQPNNKCHMPKKIKSLIWDCLCISLLRKAFKQVLNFYIKLSPMC